MAAYPDMGWALRTVRKICQRVDRTESATGRKAGCGCLNDVIELVLYSLNIFNAEKVYNFVVFQQNHISIGT